MLSYFEISPFHSAKGRKIAWARLAPELSSWMDCQEGFPKGTRRAEKRSTYGLDAWQKSIFIYMNGTWTGTLKWSESWVYSPVKWVPWTRCWRQANHTGSGLGTWDWELGTGYWVLGTRLLMLQWIPETRCTSMCRNCGKICLHKRKSPKPRVQEMLNLSAWRAKTKPDSNDRQFPETHSIGWAEISIRLGPRVLVLNEWQRMNVLAMPYKYTYTYIMDYWNITNIKQIKLDGFRF